MKGWGLLTGYPQLREAETEAPDPLPGTPVQHAATIAHGDGICATHVTAPSLVHIRDTKISTAADKPTTESGGIFA